MKSNYGNYVIQKALKLSCYTPKLNLINNIIQNLNKIGDNKLIQKWRSIIEAGMTDGVKKNDSEKVCASEDKDKDKEISEHLNKIVLQD